MFIYSNVQYPDSAFNEDIQGNVVRAFDIDTLRVLNNSRILKPVHPLLDAEAKRLVEILPNWTPATINNVSVKSSSSITVVFDIEKETELAIKRNEVTQPDFPQGAKALMNFLSKNTTYPISEIRNGTQVKVICSFIVEKDGTLRDIKVENGVSRLLNKEAVRVISIMPKWISGRVRNKLVEMRFTLPVVFRLEPVIKDEPF